MWTRSLFACRPVLILSCTPAVTRWQACSPCRPRLLTTSSAVGRGVHQTAGELRGGGRGVPRVGGTLNAASPRWMIQNELWGCGDSGLYCPRPHVEAVSFRPQNSPRPRHVCLCLTDDTTGIRSVYTVYQGHEIMFHVSTMLPHSKENKQQVRVNAQALPPWARRGEREHRHDPRTRRSAKSGPGTAQTGGRAFELSARLGKKGPRRQRVGGTVHTRVCARTCRRICARGSVDSRETLLLRDSPRGAVCLVKMRLSGT